MPSFISTGEKAALQAVMRSQAETWEEDIVVFKEPEKLIISTDPNYNPFQRNDQNIFNPTNEPSGYVIKARILYQNRQEAPFSLPYVGGNLDTAQLKDRAAEGIVRIKVNASGYAIMQEAKKVLFDNFMFTVETLERPHGLFNREYYTYFLKRDV